MSGSLQSLNGAADLALVWKDEAFAADLALDGQDLLNEGGLRTAVILSLFTDRRARADDDLPEAGADRRGWWADALAEGEDGPIGSRLWLLEREKQLPSVVARAREYAEEALAWLVRDRIASAVAVEAEITAPTSAGGGVLGLAVRIDRPSGAERFRFDYVWRTP